MPRDLLFREFSPLKIWRHAGRLQALARNEDIAPVTLEIDPVAYCNHHCSWCVDPSHTPVTASRAFLWHLLDEAAAFRVNGLGVHGIVFKGGGEPTLHPDFPGLVEKAGSLGFEVGVVTNGSRLLAPGLGEALAQNASYVRVSIDGPTAETHERIHGSRDFADIVAGVRELMACRQQRHPIVGLSFAIDYTLMSLIPEAIALGERLDVDYVLVRPPFFEEVGRPATMTPSQAAEVRRALAAAAANYAGSMDMIVGGWVGDAESALAQNSVLADSGRRDHQTRSDIPIEHRMGECWASPLLAVVAADGHVYGCCNLRFLDTWSFGQINYAQGVTLASIWSGAQRQRILTAMRHVHCIDHCTHPMQRYNDIIAVLRDQDTSHSGFV